jgi:hypothetical protein
MAQSELSFFLSRILEHRRIFETLREYPRVRARRSLEESRRISKNLEHLWFRALESQQLSKGGVRKKGMQQ